MLSRRIISSVIRSNRPPSTPRLLLLTAPQASNPNPIISRIIAIPIYHQGRHYAAAAKEPDIPLDQRPLDHRGSHVFPELDPRESDLPPWTVPPINRQTLTETPVVPYYDQQYRRYYGEPVPEEEEVLSVFSYDIHDHVTVPFALAWFFGFWAVFAGVSYLVVLMFPGEITVKRTFPYNGLEKELGTPAVAARKQEEKDETSHEEASE
jgi:NADH dehydrogenase (ubiquinone) 1 beta subcomplex subunit 8